MSATSDDPTESIPPITRERRSGRWIAAGTAGLLLVAAAAALVLRGSGGGEPARATTTAAVATAALARRDLSDSTALSGTLGYGPPHPLAGHRDGTLTWLPRPGSVITRGQQLFRTDDQPVALFYGQMPLYRTVAGRNTAGRDVRMIADNLTALGYAIGRRPAPGDRVAQPAPPPVPDPSASPTRTPAARAPTTWVTVRAGEGVLTPALTDAIKRWQRADGLPATGTVAVGDIAVESGAVRVDSVAVQPGAPANGPLMSVTPTGKVISVPTDPADAGSIARGNKVTVELPGAKTVPGTVAAVGTALATPDSSSGGDPSAAKLTVTVTVDDPKTVARFDSAEVTVDFVGETHKNVLAAPVGALVALSEGGYAVQLPAGRLVAVRTGMFANGWAEVSGAGLTAGTQVVTTS